MKITADNFADATAIINMCRELGGINFSDSNKVTPLCFAVTNGIDPTIIVGLINGEVDGTPLNQNADPNKRSDDGTTPIECAISTGTTDPVKALIGDKVPKRDKDGNPIETNVKTGKYKMDTTGENPLPVRDENDDVVYREYKGVPIPLNEGEKFISDKHQQRCMINGKLTYVPPPSYNLTGKFEDCKFSNITYLYEKDGSHKPMKDADGNKLKQCYSNGKEIHKKDANGKELKNNYEYVWDYKRLPEYQPEYVIDSVSASSTSKIKNHAILSASKLGTSDVLDVLIHKWCHCTKDSEGKDVPNKIDMSVKQFAFEPSPGDSQSLSPYSETDIENDLPIYEATNIKCIKSIELLRDHDSAFTKSVNKLTGAVASATTSAVNSGDDDLIDLLKWYMLPIISSLDGASDDGGTIETIEKAVVKDNYDTDTRKKMIGIYMPLFVTDLYNGDNSLYNKIGVDSYTTRKLGDNNTTVGFPDGRLILDYLELAVKCLANRTDKCGFQYSSYIDRQNALLGKIKDGFIEGDEGHRSARLIGENNLHLITRECYSILNLLNDNKKFKYECVLNDVVYNIVDDIKNTIRNRVAITNAVDSGDLNSAKLNNWPWFAVGDDNVVGILYDNTYSLDIQGMPSPTKKSVSDPPTTLASVSEQERHDSSGIYWHPVKWDIGEFGDSYKLEKDVIAKLVCEKIKITLEFDTSAYPDLDPVESITDDNGKTITLPEISGTFIDSDGIKRKVTGWLINGTSCEVGSSFVLAYNVAHKITATVECEAANVTLKFTNTDYSSLDIPDFPSPYTYPSGTTVTLPTLSGNYTYDDRTYTPTTWDIGAFGSSYTLKDDITANLVCEEIIVVTEVVFNDSVTELNEGGSTTRYFKLSSAPNSDVTLHISTDSNRLMISQNTITFNGGNWDSNQSVTFTAKPNSIADGDTTAIVTISTTSSDLRYNNQSYTLNPITIKDDDHIGIIYNDSSTGVVLEGNSIVRTIKLKSQPTANVTINLTSNASTRLNISPTQLTFTTGDWSSSKNVTFSANDNYDVDGDVTATVTVSCSASYYSFTDNSLHITVKDNDTAGVVYSSGIVIANEGDVVFKSFSLSSKPTSNVTLTFSSNNMSRLGIPNNSITFDSNNWGTLQDVRFNALNNDIDDDTVDVKVTAVISSVDSAYNSLSDISFYIKIIDNDVAGFTFDDTSTITLTEGESITRNVKLNSQPTQPVTITFSFPSSYSDRLSISSVQFNSNDWSDFKSVTFEALDNDIADNDISVNITVSASSSDTKYNSLPSTNLVVNVNNDDIVQPWDDSEIGYVAFTTGTFPVDDDPSDLIYVYKYTTGGNIAIGDTEVYYVDTQNVPAHWQTAYDKHYPLPDVPTSVHNFNTLYPTKH